MSIGFYDLLQVAPEAPPEAIRSAYQEQIALVVRKLRAAEARKQDVASIEARRAALGEAWAVLSDPTRRRRYDRYRELSRSGLPADPEDLWSAAGPSLVDPAAAAALEVVRALTDLRVGEPVAVPPPPVPEAEVGPVQVRPPPEPVRAVPPPIQVPPPSAEGTLVMARPAGATLARPPVVAPTGLALDRSVPTEDLARIYDHYGPTGAFLKAVRELRRIPLPLLSTNTRISLRFLDAMERDAYTDLPSATFVRGYVKMVIRALEAMPAGPELEEFAEGYMSRYHRARG